MAGFGLQFQPGVPQQNGNGIGSQQRGRVQQPVQVLSTRLPKVFGAGAIAPPSLLPGGGGGGMGQPGARGNVVAQALAQLAGLPPGMQPSLQPSPLGGGVDWSNPPRYDGGGINPNGMYTGGTGLPPPQPTPWNPRPDPAPSPPPILMPPPYNPPPPVFTPGYLPRWDEQPPPVFEHEPGPPGPPPQVVEPGGPEIDWSAWLRRHRELNPSGSGDGGNEIRQLASGLFR